MAPLLLLFNIDGEKEKKIRDIASGIFISVKSVGKGYFSTPLDGILSGKPPVFSPVATFSEEMLVMCGLPSPVLDFLLKQMRGADASVSLKAILTETNKRWSPSELHRELSLEREAVEKGTEIH